MAKTPRPMTDEELLRFTEATVNTGKIVLESKEREHDLALSTAKNVLANLEKIELKERCLRVKFLDWLSDRIGYYGATWSKKIHEMSVKIDSPCAIKLPEKKEQSKSVVKLQIRGKITGVTAKK